MVRLAVALRRLPTSFVEHAPFARLADVLCGGDFSKVLLDSRAAEATDHSDLSEVMASIACLAYCEVLKIR